MCGRFALITDPSEAAAVFNAETTETAPPRYNIGPTQPIFVIFQDFGKRKTCLMRWGFVPAWVKDPKSFSLIINARSETVSEKPSFRTAIRHRRCIIPTNGFYEWQRSGNRKVPYYIRDPSGGVTGYAGLFETWSSADGSEIDTVCFLTTAANPDIAAIHDRMPVPIDPEDAETWLDCVNFGPADVERFYTRSTAGRYEIRAVSDRVNAVRNDDPQIQDPRAEDSVVEEPPKEEENAVKPDAPASKQLSLF
ncbi:MAG: SOS response-associated peptidase [Pseudomonadota bacterium]